VLIDGAEKGDKQLMLTLGCAFLNGWIIRDGSPCPKDDPKAFEWMMKAAQAGSTHAMFVLGGLYFEGRGTTKDIKAGISWFERSANLGNELSKAVLEKIDPNVLKQYGY
jgi:TPR repeat protein